MLVTLIIYNNVSFFLAVLWGAGGILTFGFFFAFVQRDSLDCSANEQESIARKFYWVNFILCFVMASIMGPGLLIPVFGCGMWNRGLKFW